MSIGGFSPVTAVLLADTKGYSAKIDEAGAKMDALGASTDTTSQKFSNFANKASTAIISAGLAAGAVSVKMASDFQTAMTSLVTGAGEAQKNIGLVSKGILNMGGQVGETPAQLAAGMYLIESAGYHGAQGLTVLKAAAQGASVGGADLATTAGAVTSVLHDYSLGVDKSAAVTSALIETVASGKTHLEDVGLVLGKVIPTASALGVSFQQVGAALAVQTNAGVSARLAAMHLNSTMLALVAPNKVAAATMDAFGLSAQKLKDMISNPHEGLGFALQTISDTVGQKFPRSSANYTEAIKAMLGGTLGYQTLLALTGTHAKEFATDVTNIGERMKAVTPTVQGFALVQKDLSFQMHSLEASASAAAINIGNWLLPKATDVAKWANGVFDYFKKHPLVTKIASDAAIGLFAASVTYKLGKALLGVYNTFKGLLQPSETVAQTGTLMTPLEGIWANTTTLVEQGGLGGKGGGAITTAEKTGAGAGAGGVIEGAALPPGLMVAMGAGGAYYIVKNVIGKTPGALLGGSQQEIINYYYGQKSPKGTINLDQNKHKGETLFTLPGSNITEWLTKTQLAAMQASMRQTKPKGKVTIKHTASVKVH